MKAKRLFLAESYSKIINPEPPEIFTEKQKKAGLNIMKN